jgi:hypothetical protein
MPKHSPDYQIELTGGDKIPLLFNTWTFKNFTRLKGLEFEDFLNEVQSGKGFKGNDLPDLFFLAAQSYYRFNDIEFKYTDIDAYDWVDQLGGMNSTRLLDVYKIFFSRATGISIEKIETLWEQAGVQQPEPKEDKKKGKSKRGVSTT